MNFALLGDDPAVLPLVRAIAGHSECRLTHAALAGETASGVLDVAPAARMGDSWQELLGADSVDAILVAGARPDVVSGSKQLAAAGKPLVLFPQTGQGTGFVYELTLIRDDSHSVLVPVFPLRLHPHVSRLRHELDQQRYGRVLLIQMSRQIAVPGEGSAPPLISRSDVEDALLADADLLRYLGGDYDQVTAIYSGTAGAGGASEQFSLATVTLAGQGLPEATWTLRAAREPSWRLEIQAEQGTCELTGTASGRLRLRTGDSEAEAFEFDLGTALLETVLPAISRAGGTSSDEQVLPAGDWTDLTRAFEVVDATRRSLRRRRTIDLNFETTSERSQFKTQMTAVGCGLLVATFLGVLVVLAAGMLLSGDRNERQLRRLLAEGWTARQIAQADDVMPDFDRREIQTMIGRVQRTDRILRIARVAVFLPLGVFLLLQLLVFVARPGGKEPRRSAENELNH